MSMYGEYVTTILHEDKVATMKAEAARDHLARQVPRQRHPKWTKRTHKTTKSIRPASA